MKIFDAIVQGLGKNMDLRLFRQSLINTNIANADTPGYRPVELNFQKDLAHYLQSESENRMSASSNNHIDAMSNINDVKGEVIAQAGEVTPDGNAVDVDRQMAELAANAFHYQASARIINKKLGIMKYVINQAR